MGNSPFIYGPNGASNLTNTVVAGAGDGSGSAVSTTVRAADLTGTSVTGPDLVLRPGNGTGTGGSGNLIVQTAPVATSLPVVTNAVQATISSGTTITQSYTVASASNRVLLVGINQQNTGTVSSVTFNGVNLTQLSTAASSSNRLDLWYLINPSATTANIVVTFAGSTVASAQIYTLTGANQTTPFGTVASTTGASVTSITVSPTTSVGQLAIDIVGAYGFAAATPTAGQTQVQAANTGAIYSTESYKTATATSTTMSYSYGSAANGAVLLAVGVNAPPATSANTITEVLRVANTGAIGLSGTNYGSSGQVLTSQGSALPPVWSVAGGANSVKNYLGYINGANNNGNFETGTIGSWQTSFTGLTGGTVPSGAPTIPDTGVAGAVSVISSSPLAGSYSMNFSSTVATGYNLPIGHGFSSPIFTIDQEDQAKVLSFRFAYQYVSGGAVNFSGTSSNTMVIWIWDITNSAWIQPAGVYSMNQSSGVGIASGTFQTASNGSQYRLVVFCYNAPTFGTLFSMNFDDFSVGPQVSPLAPAMSDLVVYTPTVTGFGTATTFNVTSSRVADKLYVQGSFVSGTSTAVQAQMTLGYLGANGNVTSDNSGKIGATRTVGKWSSGATGAGGSILATANQNYVTFGLDSGSGTTSANASSIVSSGQTITFEFMLPINGWTSNSVASSDTDTRTVDFYGVNTANTSFTGTTITVPFTAQVDTHAGFNGGGIYTIPVAGWYTITSDNPIYATPTTGNAVLNILVNGTSKRQSYVAFTSVGQAAPISAVLSYYAKAGDQISVTLTNSTGGMALLGTVVGTQAVLSIQRISGPAVISATESVNGLYTDQSAATIGTSPATYAFAAKVRDSHNAYASGTLTIPVSGMYTFTAQMTTAALSLATNQSFSVYIYRNGVQISGIFQIGSGAANNYNALTSVSYPCLAGDLITVRPSSSVATTGYSGAGFNNFSWARVGN